jgi:hypothetical protein
MIVATLGRPDIISMFRPLSEVAELTFIEYADNWGTPTDPSLYRDVGELTLWEDAGSARQLVRRFAPDRIAMLAITSRNQVALRLEARRRKIEVVHTEHGHRLPYEVRTALTASAPRHNSEKTNTADHTFFVRSALSQPPVNAWRLLRYALAMRAGNQELVIRRFADQRRADHYLAFSAATLRYHQEADQFDAGERVETEIVGVPQFDAFTYSSPQERQDGLVVMADHQLHNGGLRGWNRDFRREWAGRLVDELRKHGMHLVVKPHPGDTTHPWTSYASDVTVLRDIPQLALAAPKAELVLATSSSLQLPLLAAPKAAGIALEIHPEDGPPLSAQVADAGVAEPVATFEELSAAISRRDEIQSNQARAKEAFVREYLGPLDGGATARLTRALLAEPHTTESTESRAS